MIRPLTLAFAALAATAAIPAWAADPAPAASRQCFASRSVTSFSAPDSDHVYVRVGVSDVYAFRLFGPCPDVRWTEGVGLKSTGAGDWICSGLDAELLVPSPIGPRRCPVRDIRKLTPAEVAALPKGAKP